MSVSGASYGPSNVAFDAIDDFLFYWAYALLFLSICLLVRKRQLLTHKVSDLNPPRIVPRLYYSAFALLIIFGIVTSSLAVDYANVLFNLAILVGTPISQIERKAELAADLRYTYYAIWYFSSACLAGYVVHTYLELKKASISDKVRRIPSFL